MGLANEENDYPQEQSSISRTGKIKQFLKKHSVSSITSVTSAIILLVGVLIYWRRSGNDTEYNRTQINNNRDNNRENINSYPNQLNSNISLPPFNKLNSLINTRLIDNTDKFSKIGQPPIQPKIVNLSDKVKIPKESDSHMPLYYAYLLHQAFNNNKNPADKDLNKNILYKLFHNNSKLQSYSLNWQNVQNRNKLQIAYHRKDDESASFRNELHNVVQGGNIFSTDNADKNNFECIQNQKYQKAKTVIKRDIKGFKSNKANLAIEQEVGYVFHKISKNVYDHVDDYLNKLYDQITKQFSGQHSKLQIYCGKMYVKLLIGHL